MRQFAATAEADGEAGKALAERLLASMDAALWLTLQDVVAAAVAEITCALAPAGVEVRLRGRDLEFVVTPAGGPPADSGAPDAEASAGGLPESSMLSSEGEDAHQSAPADPPQDAGRAETHSQPGRPLRRGGADARRARILA
jgi:hypothetical protein